MSRELIVLKIIGTVIVAIMIACIAIEIVGYAIQFIIEIISWF